MEFQFNVITDDDQVKGREQEIYDAIVLAIEQAMYRFKDGGPMGNSRGTAEINYEIEGNFHR